MLTELFAQHPLPWRADCALTEFEAYAAVRDANENIVWEADDGTAQRAGRGTLERSDILLAHAIAALPDQYGLLCGILEALEHGDPWTKQARANTAASIRAALVKAGAKDKTE